jgi:opacity protein-like surface antigen
MKKLLIFGIIWHCTYFHAQLNTWSIEMSYPMVIDNNFVGQNFNGLLDLGLNYNIHEQLNYRISGSLHNSLFKDRTEIIDPNTDFDYLLWFIQPRVKVDFIFNNLPQVHPYLGIGYSFMVQFTNGNAATFFPESGSTRSGFNIIGGLTFDIKDHWYANAGYDFVKLSQTGNASNPYLQNVNVIKIGFGYKF